MCTARRIERYGRARWGSNEGDPMKLVVSGLLVVLAAGTASASSIATIAGQLGATNHTGTIGPSKEGRVLQTDNFGVHTAPNTSYTTYAIPSGDPTNGELCDFRWVHETSPHPGGVVDPNDGTIWIFTNGPVPKFSQNFYLVPAIDHAPLYEESFETTLWGSNDGGSTWLLGTITDTYEQGFDATAIVDDGASRWHFPQAVNMISATWGLAQGTYSYFDLDTEIDCVTMDNGTTIPLPSAGLLGLAGLGLVASRRGRRLA